MTSSAPPTRPGARPPSAPRSTRSGGAMRSGWRLEWSTGWRPLASGVPAGCRHGVTELVLGPALRYAGETEALIWVETDAACTVSVLGCESRTFCVEGHHYALVKCDGLEPGTITPYEVHLDGERVWPLDDGSLPPSYVRTHDPAKPTRIVFGSCPACAPHRPPHDLPKDKDPQGREVDALRALAQRMEKREPAEWPEAMLLLGDQVYADE